MRTINGTFVNGLSCGVLKACVAAGVVQFPPVCCECGEFSQVLLIKDKFLAIVPGKNGIELSMDCDCGQEMFLKITNKEYADVLCKLI